MSKPNTVTYSVNFNVRGSYLGIEEFVAWVMLERGYAMSEMMIQSSDGSFYQENRSCSCGSHYFRDSTSDPQKVCCLRCGLYLPIQ